MASVDSPRGRPRVRWRDPDGTPRARTCRTEKAARELLVDVQRCEDLGRIWKPEEPRAIPSLRSIGNAWIKHCLRRLAPRTVDRLSQMGDAFLDWAEIRHGKGCPPDVLTKQLLEAYWDHLLKPATGRYVHSREPTTARKHLEAIHLLWTWAAEREEYDGDVPRVRKMELPRKPAVTPRPAPTWAEMDRCIVAAEGWRRNVLIIMRCTGLRVQQAMGLRWADLRGNALTIRGELGKSEAEREGRVVPVAPALLLEWSQRRIAEWSDPDWICPCPLPHRTVRARDVARIWKRAGVAPESWAGRPDHAFRAGFQSNLRESGVSREATEYLVGHAMPGLDASYIDPWRAYGLLDAVAKVPAMDVPAMERRERA
jgi:integrase